MPSDPSVTVHTVGHEMLEERHIGLDRSQGPPPVVTLCEWLLGERLVGTLTFDVATLRYELVLPGRRIGLAASHRRLDDLDASRPATESLDLDMYRAERTRWVADLDRAIRLTYPDVASAAIGHVRAALDEHAGAATG